VTVDAGPVDWNDALGQAVAAVNSFAKNAYVRDLAYNSVGGTVQAVRKWGGWVGQAPHGYTVEWVPCPEANRKHYSRLVIDPEKAAVVRELFERYATGTVSLRALARELNQRGVPSPKGKAGEEWAPCSLRRMLSNPAYVGDTVYNRSSQGKLAHVEGGEAAKIGREERLRRAKARRERDERLGRPKGGKKPKGQSKPRFHNPPEEWVVRKDTHKPLVSRDLFAKVQQLLPKRRGRKGERKGEGKGSHAYLYSGLVRCAHCDRCMQGQVAYTLKSGESVRRYVCSGNNNNGTCRHRVVYERELTDAIRGGLWADLVSDPKKLASWQRGVASRLKAKYGAAGEGLKRLTAEIADLAKKVGRARENLLLLPKDMLGGAVEKVREMEGRLRHLEARKAAAGQAARLAVDIDARVEAATKRLVALGTGYHDDQGDFDHALVSANVGLVEAHFEERVRVVKATGERRSQSVPARVRVVFRAESLLGAELAEMFMPVRRSCRSAAPRASPWPPCP
jgi:hypothetical protein